MTDPSSVSPRFERHSLHDVYVFGTCLVDQFVPQAGVDCIRLLEREGLCVHYPLAQTCCGQPAHSSGYVDEARAVAAQQIALFSQPWPVVVPSGSCAGMLRVHYPHLFASDDPLHAQALDLAERVFELGTFLLEVMQFKRADQGEPETVALHTSCHARRQMGVAATSQALLAQLDQVSVCLPERVEECCGFGGTFSLLHPEISQAIVSDKVAALCATGAQRVVSADCGCLLNITGRAQRLDAQAGASAPRLVSEHLASFLWRRTGGAA